jgi:DNA-binding CsgD family transcriptional regulator
MTDDDDTVWLPTENQRRLVALYAEGYGRWKIAEMLGVSESAVKKTGQSLCRRFNCGYRDLPAKLAAYDAGHNFSFLSPPPEVAGAVLEEDDDGRITV